MKKCTLRINSLNFPENWINRLRRSPAPHSGIVPRATQKSLWLWIKCCFCFFLPIRQRKKPHTWNFHRSFMTVFSTRVALNLTIKFRTVVAFLLYEQAWFISSDIKVKILLDSLGWHLRKAVVWSGVPVTTAGKEQITRCRKFNPYTFTGKLTITVKNLHFEFFSKKCEFKDWNYMVSKNTNKDL